MAIQLGRGFRPADPRNFDDRRRMRAKPDPSLMLKPLSPANKPGELPTVAAGGKLNMAMIYAVINAMDVNKAAGFWDFNPFAVRPLPRAHWDDPVRFNTVAVDTQARADKLAAARTEWRYMGGGVNGKVYEVPGDGWVVKKAKRNDGTRTYLEWVMARTQAGRRMRGMPEVGFLFDAGEGYVVSMRKYGSAYAKIESEGLDINWPWYSSVAYLKDLVEAFERETGVEADDLHKGNALLDPLTGDYIVTDPSNGGYSSVVTLH